ncbi:hypothetical protein Q1695_008541 [Nippostrongylus brasiliensis]|nr:hypothetical protein Q1695_008541 [Nippostrongylus brasiliensis]
MRGPTAGLHKVRENTVSESCIQGDDEAFLWQNVQLMRRHVLRRPEPELSILESNRILYESFLLRCDEEGLLCIDV